MAELEVPNVEELEEQRGKTFTKRVALTTAIFAVILAITSLGGNNAMKEMLLAQQQASDQWAFYQAKVIREHLYRSQKLHLEADLLERGNLMQNGKFVILCVDDDQDLLDALRLVLEKNGYMMIAARTAEEGLKTYKQVNPDLIIIDLMMEEVDAGANFVKEMKLLNNTAPVFLLSGAGDGMSQTTDYTQLGFSGVFQKPVTPNRLLSVLQAKLKR
jgi:CheY-like chemotaxis protein